MRTAVLGDTLSQNLSTHNSRTLEQKVLSSSQIISSASALKCILVWLTDGIACSVLLSLGNNTTNLNFKKLQVVQHYVTLVPVSNWKIIQT
jgi:hypothetical protein